MFAKSKILQPYENQRSSDMFAKSKILQPYKTRGVLDMKMRVIIIGGGLAGLSAAYQLADSHEVTVIEKEKGMGGLAASYTLHGKYHIEKYYHHIFDCDRETIDLINKLGLGDKLEWIKSTTSYYARGEIWPMNTPFQVLRFPELSTLDIIRLAGLVLGTRKAQDILELDEITARDWIIRKAGQRVYDGFFMPLLRGKFGSNIDNVSAAWLVSRIKLRSNRSASGERLGYIHGGFQQLVSRLAEQVENIGGSVHAGETALSINIPGNKVNSVETVSETLECDAVISTVALPVLKDMLKPEPPPGLASALGSMKYQGTACALIATRERITEDTYWLNIKDADVPFGALIEHTNFIPAGEYGGEHLTYITSYFQGSGSPLWKSSEEEVAKTYLEGLEHILPGFSREQVRWWKLTRDLYTAPVYITGYASGIPPYRMDIEGLYMAGMFSPASYPERSINSSIVAGMECASELLKSSV